MDAKTRKRLRKQKKKLQSFHFSRMVPNMTTLIALCTGLSAIRFAMQEQFAIAVFAIIIAAILDMMDGRIARFLGASSHFGAELDSLSDSICFGVSPAIMIYIVSLYQLGNIGWAMCLFFVACQTLRLARFNTVNLMDTEETTDLWKKKYFTGVPAPAGAMLALLPLIFGFAFDIPMEKFPLIHSIFMVGTALLMVSKIPTFSLKGLQIKTGHILPLMLVSALFIVILVTHPWLSLLLFWMMYLVSIPFSIRSYSHNAKKYTLTKNNETGGSAPLLKK